MCSTRVTLTIMAYFKKQAQKLVFVTVKYFSCSIPIFPITLLELDVSLPT